MSNEAKQEQRSATELAKENVYELPWVEDGWRPLYERIIPLARPLLSGMLTQLGTDPPAAYRDWDGEPHLGPTARHLAHAVPLVDQAAFLEASGGIPEPWEPSDERCGCRIGEVSRCSGYPRTRCDRWLQRAFIRRFTAVLRSAYRRQLAYDRELGLPPRLKHTRWRRRTTPEADMIGRPGSAIRPLEPFVGCNDAEF